MPGGLLMPAESAGLKLSIATTIRRQARTRLDVGHGISARADRGRSGENEGEGHMTNKTTVAPLNVLDYLTTSAMIDAYVAEAYASGDSEYIAEALETAAIARDRIKTAPRPTPDLG